MLANLWNFLLGKKLARFKDEVLSVSDILPAKSMVTSKNDLPYLSDEPAANADHQAGGSAGSSFIDSKIK